MKKKTNEQHNEVNKTIIEGISKLGKKIIGSGILLLIIGFFVLTKTDPEGQNWASVLSPFLIVSGYITIAVGIIFPEKK